jgi:5-methyltetrahydropteroyltriglutamate--homocysteine methyltransferase
LRSITDGEFRRESWRLGFVSKVAGFGRANAIGEVDIQRDDAGNEARIGSAPVAIEKVRRAGPIVADEVAFSLKHARATVKATLPAPSYLHYPRGAACVDPNAYPDLEQFLADVVEIYVFVLAAFVGYQVRSRAVETLGIRDLYVALVEDVVAIAGCLWIVSFVGSWP